MDGVIATLWIPLKLQLATEPSRLPVQVLEYKNGQYKLQCRHGWLSGQYQGGELNTIDDTVGAFLGSSIWTKPDIKDGKELTVTLPSAVAKENSRGTITKAQKAGRATKPHVKPGPKPGRKPGPKPCPKAGTKRKRGEVEIDSEDPSPRRLRRRC